MQPNTSPDPAEPARRVLLLDCDAFFVQVARLEDPEGVGREDLVIVGGRPDGRGVVASASYGARAYGVRSAMPTSQALRLCPHAVVVPVPREACGRTHRRIREVLDGFSPLVEAASIDEFYLDLSGTERLYGDEPLEATARRIQQAVHERTRVVVSVGGGTRRLIAKLAVERAKPGGIHVVPAGHEAAFLEPLPLADIPGVGPVFAETLRRRGLRTVRDARAYDEATLCAWLGAGRGGWLFRRVHGIDDTPVGERGEARSISHERTFAADIHSLDELIARLLPLVSDLGAELRRKRWRARTVTVYVRDRDFRDRRLGRTLDAPIESDRAISAAARAQLRELWERRGIGVRLVGVALSNLVPADFHEQLRLDGIAPAQEDDRDRSLSHAADRLRARFGKESLVLARQIRKPAPGDER
jgi:DNA polymerase IV